MISFVSAKGGLGKTSVISMLARSLSDSGKMVCVIDGVFALNELSFKFDSKRTFDLFEYLIGNIGIHDVLNKHNENLFFIKTNDPRFDYASREDLICELIVVLCERFDYVLIEVSALNPKSLNMFLKASSEAFVIVDQEREVLLNSIKLLDKIKNYKNITNIKLILNKFKVISELLGECMGEEEIETILRFKILFSFPQFLKYNIFKNEASKKYFLYSSFFKASVEENLWKKIDYKKEYSGMLGKIKRWIYFKFE